MVMYDRRLELFINVAEKKSIKQTAEEMFISQPAVSKAIRSLEEELQIMLFLRDRVNGLTLTDAGREIYHYAKSMAESDERIREAASAYLDCRRGTLRLGSLPILSTAVLPLTLSEYRKQYPDVTIEMYENTPRGLRDALYNHIIELAVTCSPFDEFEHEVIAEDCLVAIFGPETEKVPEHITLSDQEGLLLTVNSALETFEDVVRQSLRHRPSELIRFDNPETVVKMVEQNIGIGLISKFTLNAINPELRSCPVYPPIEFELGMQYLAQDSLSPAAAAFLEILRITGFGCK